MKIPKTTDRKLRGIAPGGVFDGTGGSLPQSVSEASTPPPPPRVIFFVDQV